MYIARTSPLSLRANTDNILESGIEKIQDFLVSDVILTQDSRDLNV